jgi:hypothetical protein
MRNLPTPPVIPPEPLTDTELEAVEAAVLPIRIERAKQNQWAQQTGYHADNGPIVLCVNKNNYMVTGPDLDFCFRL